MGSPAAKEPGWPGPHDTGLRDPAEMAPHCPPWTPDPQALDKVTGTQAPILGGSNLSWALGTGPHTLCTCSSLRPHTTVALRWVGGIKQATVPLVPTLSTLEPWT